MEWQTFWQVVILMLLGTLCVVAAAGAIKGGKR